MTSVQTKTIAEEDSGIRLDRWFKRHFPALGHGKLERLLREGQIRLDGKRAKAGDRVEPGQSVRVPPLHLDEAAKAYKPRLPASERDLAKLKSLTIYEDKNCLVIDKPPGLPVQGGTASERNLDAMFRAAEAALGYRALLVHRLDRDTSGVLLLAKSPAAAAQLSQAFRRKEARKLYWAILVGKPPHPFGTVDMPVRRQMGAAGERVVVLDDLDDDADLDELGARRAITDFAIIDRAADRFAFVALEPRTGRTHQLRVHMAAIGSPILGDGKYGGSAAHPKMAGIARQVHLHARRLAIPKPGGGSIDVMAPPPRHFRDTLEALEFETSGADRFVDEISREHERRIA